jgi:hypothetical protein
MIEVIRLNQMVVVDSIPVAEDADTRAGVTLTEAGSAPVELLVAVVNLNAPGNL